VSDEPEKRWVGYSDTSALPVKKGQRVTIKKGVRVYSRTHPKRKAYVSARHYKVRVHAILQGYKDDDGVLVPPRILWPGAGGYWCEVDLNDIPEAVSAIPTIAEVESRLKWPVDGWKGQCFGVASQMVAKGLVRGTAVYGHYLGAVNPEGYFGKRTKHSFVQHGWVLMGDGRILDPTRWVFENTEPYIYVAKKNKDYDEGGNELRAAFKRPAPAFDSDEKCVVFKKDVLPTAPWNFIEKLLPLNLEQEPGTLSISQVYWLANLPYEDLFPYTAVIYKAIAEVGEEVAIPWDNRMRAERELKSA
jgi:hypothetical protein